MRRLFEALAADGRQRDFLVWGGVGDGRFLGAARALGAKHSLFIEPHPGLRERLAARQEFADNELLSDRPLWRESGRAIFHVTNDATSSSLVPPTQHLGARRNIRVVEERDVDTDSLDSALASLPAEDQTGLLVLDACGAEQLIVQGASAEALARFDTLVVPARERERIGEHLGERGFHAARAVHDENGNEWAVFVAGSASESPQVEGLRSELVQRQEEIDALRMQLEAATTQLEATQSEQVRVIEALQAEQAVQVSELQARAAALAAERDTQAAHALDLQQKLTSFSGEAEQTIAALTSERDTANQRGAQATARVAELEPEIEKGRARVSELESRVSDLEQQLVEARQVSTLSVKLQAQRDADLADLQERYRESQAVQARQRELLEKLGARLSVASHYFHQLADGRGLDRESEDGTDAALQADFDGVPR